MGEFRLREGSRSMEQGDLHPSRKLTHAFG